jgi:hypothetical protein
MLEDWLSLGIRTVYWKGTKCVAGLRASIRPLVRRALASVLGRKSTATPLQPCLVLELANPSDR